MLLYNVYGRYIGVKREKEEWLTYRVDMNERKFSRLHDVYILDTLTEDEIGKWLGDIYHEAATEQHPDVTRIE